MAKLPLPIRKAWKRANKRARHALATKSPAWVRRRLGPTGLRFDMLVLDLGALRTIYPNTHAIDNHVWRSAQPTPGQIHAWAKRGIKTVVNLRGAQVSGSYALEKQACAEAGVKLIDFQVRSRAAPSREELRAVRDLFDRVDYPILMHCKSGADRAGLMGVLYRHLKLGHPIEVALQELSWKFGHVRNADTGVLDAFFERYLSDTAKQPMAFFDWVENIYDADELKRTFHASSWANRLVNGVLRRE
jgi:uncharacterized protein (TIGR01244 family)